MRELEYPFDNNFILRKRRALRKQLLQEKEERIKIRIAVLGGSTTADIVSTLELFLMDADIEPVIYESAFNSYYEDAVFGNPELDSFQPQIVFIHTSIQNIQMWPDIMDTEDILEQKIEEEYRRLEQIWRGLEAKYGAIIIQNNFERPLLGGLGNREVSDKHGYADYINQINMKLYQYSRVHGRFYIHDVEGLASEYGLRKWQDFRSWYLYKICMPMNAIPEFSYHLAAIIKAIYGKSKKILVLDADNTLWNGVIGEGGISGIDIGKETEKGQSFLAWQTYIKRLRRQGVLLAIASKNEEEAVREGLSHPDCVLNESDFSAMAINWEDKASNLVKISRELNIGLNFMVFVDDNPAERELIRQRLPEVYVLEANYPEEFLVILGSAHLFEALTITPEDISRTEMYAANKKRETEKNNFTDYNDYLKSLSMRAEIASFETIYYDRITQLINKTNQFNLTTWRMTKEQVIKYAESQEWICLYGKLYDRFGDNGIVSIIMAEKREMTAHIHLMVLSCRVFKRQMEFAMMDMLARRCSREGIKEIIGYYYPTHKNRLVKSFYREAGFAEISEDEKGISVWKIQLSNYENKNTVISVEEKD